MMDGDLKSTRGEVGSRSSRDYERSVIRRMSPQTETRNSTCEGETKEKKNERNLDKTRYSDLACVNPGQPQQAEYVVGLGKGAKLTTSIAHQWRGIDKRPS